MIETKYLIIEYNNTHITNIIKDQFSEIIKKNIDSNNDHKPFAICHNDEYTYEFYIIKASSYYDINKKFNNITKYYNNYILKDQIFYPVLEHGKVILKDNEVNTTRHIRYNTPLLFTDVIEFYEFHIANYPMYNQERKFKIFNKTNPNNCGIVYSFNPNDEYNISNVNDQDLYKNSISSCDPITSDEKADYDSISTDHNIPYNINHYKNNYYRLTAKKNTIDYKLYASDLKDITYNIEKATKILMDYVNINHPKVSEKSALIYKIKVDNNTKVIVFGDFHGSFHTFFRNINRLIEYNAIYVSDNKYIVNDGFIIIFLGDVIDRGYHSLDIINFIFDFMMNNNTSDKLKVIYNRGNHEETDTFKYYGLLTELKDKINIDNIEHKNLADEFLKSYQTSLKYLSSAILLQTDFNNYWLSHGGFPCLDMGQVFMPFNKDNHPNDIITDKIHLVTDSGLAKQIRWNDFGDEKGFIKETIFNTNRSDKESEIYTDNIYIIGRDDLSDFLNVNNINFIIRAHQDNFSNSFLFSSSGINIINKKQVPESDIYYNDKYDKGLKNSVNGPIARLDLGTYSIKHRVLTISTCTDLDRPLFKDSFIVINNYFDKSLLNDFSPDVNTFDYSTNKKQINKSNKLNSFDKDAVYSYYYRKYKKFKLCLSHSDSSLYNSVNLSSEQHLSKLKNLAKMGKILASKIKTLIKNELLVKSDFKFVYYYDDSNNINFDLYPIFDLKGDGFVTSIYNLPPKYTKHLLPPFIYSDETTVDINKIDKSYNIIFSHYLTCFFNNLFNSTYKWKYNLIYNLYYMGDIEISQNKIIKIDYQQSNNYKSFFDFLQKNKNIIKYICDNSYLFDNTNLTIDKNIYYNIKTITTNLLTSLLCSDYYNIVPIDDIINCFTAMENCLKKYS